MSKSNCQLIRRSVAGHTAYFFAYRAGEMDFEFSMLCEVGQPYIPSFEAIIAERGLKLKTIEINQRPWIITVEA